MEAEKETRRGLEFVAKGADGAVGDALLWDDLDSEVDEAWSRMVLEWLSGLSPAENSGGNVE